MSLTGSRDTSNCVCVDENWIMFWWTVGTISICHDESRRGGHTCRRLLVNQLKNSRKQHQDRGNRTDDATETELKIGLKYKLIWGGGEVKVEWGGGTKRTEKELKGNSRRRRKQIKHKWNVTELTPALLVKTKTDRWWDVVFLDVSSRVCGDRKTNIWSPNIIFSWPDQVVLCLNQTGSWAWELILKRNVTLKHKDVSTCLWFAEMCRQFTLSGLEWWYRTCALKDGWQNNILQEKPASDVTAERNTPNGFWFNLKDEETAKILWRESKYLWNLDFILT